MIFLYVILGLVSLHFILIFIILRLVVPFMGFGRFKMPEKMPQNIRDAIAELESKSLDANGYLKVAYDLVISKWHAARFATVLYAPAAFRTNLEKIWNTPGFAHCHTQNYMLFVLLAGSKFLTNEDIEPRTVFFNFFIHQYLKVKVGDKIINVDPAGASIRGKPLGEYIKWFG